MESERETGWDKVLSVSSDDRLNFICLLRLISLSKGAAVREGRRRLTRGQRGQRPPPPAATPRRWSNSDTGTWGGGEATQVLMTLQGAVGAILGGWGGVLQLDTALAHIVVVPPVRTATPLRAVVGAAGPGAGQSPAGVSAG